MQLTRPLLFFLLLAAPALAQQQQLDSRVQAMQQAVAARIGALEMENAQLRVLLDGAQQDAKSAREETKTARDELAKSKAPKPAGK